MTPLFQAIFACGLASARYARLRSTTRPSIPNLQKRIYTTIYCPLVIPAQAGIHFNFDIPYSPCVLL